MASAVDCVAPTMVSCSCRSSKAAPPQQLRLDLAAALMPHPSKVHRGGEDAVFLSDDGLTFGELTTYNLQADDL